VQIIESKRVRLTSASSHPGDRTLEVPPQFPSNSYRTAGGSLISVSQYAGGATLFLRL
jgi:hypothetical protein